MFRLDVVVKVFLLPALVRAKGTREGLFARVEHHVARHVKLVIATPKHFATVRTDGHTFRTIQRGFGGKSNRRMKLLLQLAILQKLQLFGKCK